MDRRLEMNYFTNFYDHPSDNRYMIFRYLEEEYAAHFEEELKKEGIEYERYVDFEDSKKPILFGINKRWRKQTERINYLTYAKYRKPLINSALGRWVLIGVVFIVIVVAVVGYIKSRIHLDSFQL